MPAGLSQLWLAALFLLATHFVIASTGVRAALVRALGERLYLGLYSLIAAVALVWLGLAYGRAPVDRVLWDFWPVSHIAAIILMPLALILLVGGLSTPNPTAVGGVDPAKTRVASVLRVTRNPVMWAIGLWAVLHLLANGDPPAAIMFGSLAVLALLGSHVIDVKNRERRAAAFAPFEQATSNLPFLAMIQGRQSLGRAVREFGWVRLGVVVLLYAVLLHGHRWLFGVSPYAGL